MEKDNTDKSFISIKVDPLDNVLPFSSMRAIHVDEIEQIAVIGPIVNPIDSLNFDEATLIIDEDKFDEYSSLLFEFGFSFDLHILLKNGELISRSYFSNLLDKLDSNLSELKKIGITILDHSIQIDDSHQFRASANFKFHFRQKSEESVSYKRVERDISFEGNIDIGDGKVKLVSMVIDLIRDIFKISPKNDNKT